MIATLLVLTCVLCLTHGYGEGNADVAPWQPPPVNVLRWDPSSDISQCVVLHPGKAHASLLLRKSLADRGGGSSALEPGGGGCGF